MTASRALITGASAGLGAEFARQLASKGKDLILVARRTEPMVALARNLADEFNVDVDVIQADLSDAEATAMLFAEVNRRGHAVDYLINNAGSAGPDLLDDRDWPAQQKYIELMMTSVAGRPSLHPTHARKGIRARAKCRVCRRPCVAGGGHQLWAVQSVSHCPVEGSRRDASGSWGPRPRTVSRFYAHGFSYVR